MLQYRAGIALGQQQAPDDLAVAAKPGNHDGSLLLLRDFFHLGHTTIGKARQQQLVNRHQHQRAEQHRHRDRANQQRCRLGREYLGPQGRLKHHKCKLPALRQQKCEHRPILKRQTHGAGQRINHYRLDGQKPQYDDRHQAG